ncbi:MAG: hypothetical protein Q9208_004832 [Pyrenodesmia sp. 3 TL-2023]
MAPSSHFQYDHELAEDEIRLIVVQPGSKADPININILYRSPDNSVRYDALSYVWGTQSNPVKITCEGQPLFITRNLHKALLQLRGNGHTGPIWIDAICIDQSNLDERTRQVRMMREIYSQAEMVRIWLGEAGTDTKRGVDLIHRIAKAVDNALAVNDAEHLNLDGPDFPPSHGPEWRSVAEVLTRPWFERIWVIQERTVARACVYMCGRYEISSHALILLTVNPNLISQLQQRLKANKPQGVDRLTISISSPLIARRHAEKGLKLATLLGMTIAHKATDPRDKIFALVGLTTGVPGDFIDYNHDLRKVLIDLCLLFLTPNSGHIDPALSVLSFVNHAHRSLDLPSWVSEWEFKGDFLRPLQLIIAPGEWVETGEASYRIGHGQKLIVRGRILDKIKTLVESPPTPGRNDSVSKTAAGPQWQQWYKTVDTIVLSLDSYPSGLDLEEALWRTMCFNGGNIAEPAPTTWAQLYKAWIKVQAAAARLLDGVDSPFEKHQLVERTKHDFEISQRFDITLSRWQAGRCFCVTEKGYIGWISEAAKEGDVVVALWGTRLLFTLQPIEGGYRLTGDCYLQGLMEGEALKMDDIVDEEFVII